MSDDNPGGAALTVPLDADGKIGALPEPLQKFFDSRIADAVRRATEKAARTAPSPAKDAIDPQEHEALRTRLADLEHEREQRELIEKKNFDEALAKREEKAAKERQRLSDQFDVERKSLTEAQQKAQQRAERQARRQVEATIRAAAVQHGAREESLDELVELLSPKVGLEEQDDDYAPVVLDKDGDPIDGGVAQLVADYLATKPHHKRSGGGQSAGTVGAGGAAVTTQARKIEAIQQRIAKRGRATADDLRELEEAQAS